MKHFYQFQFVKLVHQSHLSLFKKSRKFVGFKQTSLSQRYLSLLQQDRSIFLFHCIDKFVIFLLNSSEHINEVTVMLDTELSLYKRIKDHFIQNETIQTVKSGITLFHEKDRVENIYILLQGSVCLGRIHMKGKEFTMKILYGEELIIEYQLFKPNPYYHFYAKTITDCKLLVINRLKFEEFVKQDVEVLTSLTAWLSTRYLKAQMKSQDLIMNGKKGGLYSILIRLCHSYGIMTDEGIEIDLPLTHQELANLTYGTREVIQRMLKELRENDIISYDQQKFIIKDLKYLKDHVDCQNCPYEICGLN